MSDPQPTKQPKRRPVASLARGVGSVTSQVDEVAGHFEQFSESVVHRAAARVEARRGGSYAVAILHRLRDGVVFMVRDWRLMLLQLPAAVAVTFALYRVRVRALGVQEIAAASASGLLAWTAISTVVFAVVFTCGTVFAFALTKAVPGQRANLPAAWAETRARWRALAVWTVAGALVVAALFLAARRFERLGYTVIGLAGIAIFVSLIAFVPIRMTAVGPHKPRLSTKERARGMAVGSSASLIMEAPTIGMGEVGRLFAQVPGLRVIGYLAMAIGGVLHMAASSSVRALKLTTKLSSAEDGAHPADERKAGLADPDALASPTDQQFDHEQQHRGHDERRDGATGAEA